MANESASPRRWRRLFPAKARWWEWRGTLADNHSVPPMFYILGCSNNTTCLQPEVHDAPTRAERY